MKRCSALLPMMVVTALGCSQGTMSAPTVYRSGYTPTAQGRAR